MEIASVIQVKTTPLRLGKKYDLENCRGFVLGHTEWGIGSMCVEAVNKDGS